MYNKPRHTTLGLTVLVGLLVGLFAPLAGANSPLAAPGSLADARLEVQRSEQRLLETTEARDAAVKRLAEVSSRQADVIEAVAETRSQLQAQAIEAYVSDPGDSLAMVLIGGEDLSDASAKSNMLSSSMEQSNETAVRYESMRRSIDPEVLDAAAELNRLDQELAQAEAAAIQARANEREAERIEEIRLAEQRRREAAEAAARREAAQRAARAVSAARASRAAAATVEAAAVRPPTTNATPAAPAAVATPAAPPRSLPAPPPGGPSEAQWAKLRNCESSGNYRAVNPSGKYRGAYQFDYRTWAGLGGTGDPAAASPAEQDLRAKMLYAQRGWRPWPECGRFLR